MRKAVLRLVPKAKLTPEQGARAKVAIGRALAGHPEAEALLSGALADHIDGVTRGACSWEFLQMSPEVSGRITKWICTEAPRRKDMANLWAFILVNLDKRDGRITKSRDEIAKALKLHPSNVSRCMSALHRVGVLHKVMVGREAVYALNPWVGTRLDVTKGAEARRVIAPPRLVVRDGVAVDRELAAAAADPRQAELESVLVDQMQRTGRLPWDVPGGGGKV